jgi:hypothetical protein
MGKKTNDVNGYIDLAKPVLGVMRQWAPLPVTIMPSKAREPSVPPAI